MALVFSPGIGGLRYPPGRIQRGLTSWWPLDSSTVEYSPASQTVPKDIIGAIYGSNALSTGADSGAFPGSNGGIYYNFNAGSQYLTLASDPLRGTGSTADRTAAFWINVRAYTVPDGAGTVPRLIGFSTDWVLAMAVPGGGLGADGNLNLDPAGATGFKLSPSLPLGTWTHVAVVTRNGGTSDCYINGVAVSVTSGGPGNGGDAGVWGIGCRNIAGSGTERGFDGQMAEVMVFAGTALTASEVNTLYESYFQSVLEFPLLTAQSTPPVITTNFGSLMPMMGVGP